MKHTRLNTAILFISLFICLIPQYISAQEDPNTVTFDNKSGEPALVKVIGPSGHTIEVPNGQSRTVNAAVGEYYILVRYGSNPEKYKYAKGDPFTVTQTATQYSATTITLHPIVGGNYPTHPISAEEFEKIHVTTKKEMVDSNSTDCQISNCKKIFSIHKSLGDGFIVSKCIAEGAALTDYEIFSKGNCIVVDLDDTTATKIETPIGILTAKEVYYIDAKMQPIPITTNYRFTYKNASGICYFVPRTTDTMLHPKKRGFNLFNWESESFTYCRQMENGILIINPKKIGNCKGSSGTVTGFPSCNEGIGF